MRASAAMMRSSSFCISAAGYDDVSLRSSVASNSASRVVSSFTDASVLIWPSAVAASLMT